MTTAAPLSSVPIFRESLAREITPWRLVESSPRFPDNFTFPAFCGSGRLFYGLDASGLQGLTSGLAAKHIPWFGTNADDLYIFHKRMHSIHLIYDDFGDLTNQMPLGYLTYIITIDDVEMHPGSLFTHGHDWQRCTDLRDGSTCSSYAIDGKIRLSIDHVIPMGTSTPHFRWTLVALDGKPHRITLRFELKLRLRGGTPLWDTPPQALESDAHSAIIATARTLKSGAYQPADDYALAWGLALEGATHQANSHYLTRPNRYTLVAQRAFTLDPEAPVSFDSCVAFGTQQAATPAAIRSILQAQIPAGQTGSFAGALAGSAAYWKAFYDRTAALQTGADKTDFLYHKSLQLLDAGLALDSGLPPSFQGVAGCPWWSNSSFHDTMYAARGLLHANALEESSELLSWLRDYCWQKEERPIYWLTRFDGLALTKDKNDLGFLALATLGLVPILFTETLGPEALRRDGTYAMLHHIVTYTAARLLTRQEGRYYLTVAVTQDLGTECYVNKSQQDAFILLGLRTIFRKTHAYAAALGVDAAERELWLDIANHLHVPRDEAGFLLANDHGPRFSWPFCWLPVFNLSPQDPALPPAQIDQWKEHLRNHAEGQAWGYFVFAVCALSWRDGALAQHLLDEGIRQGSYGLGYFSEFFLDGLQGPYAGSLANLPPFATAHGTFLIALFEQFARGSLWESRLEVGPLPGAAAARGPWSMQRARPLGGTQVSAAGDPEHIQGSIVAPSFGPPVTVTLMRPAALQSTSAKLTHGQTVTTLAPEAPVQFTIAAGTQTTFRLEGMS